MEIKTYNKCIDKFMRGFQQQIWSDRERISEHDDRTIKIIEYEKKEEKWRNVNST